MTLEAWKSEFAKVEEGGKDWIHETEFSEDRIYRYWLEYVVREDVDSACLFIMLNPSTADEVQSDPTVTRCKNYSARWGYGKLWVCNLFAFRATDRKVMKRAEDPIGCLNDYHIYERAKKADMIVCAWGTDGKYMNRGVRVSRHLKLIGLADKVHHLGLNADGSPKHPLYLRENEKPELWDIEWPDSLPEVNCARDGHDWREWKGDIYCEKCGICGEPNDVVIEGVECARPPKQEREHCWHWQEHETCCYCGDVANV